MHYGALEAVSITMLYCVNLSSCCDCKAVEIYVVKCQINQVCSCHPRRLVLHLLTCFGKAGAKIGELPWAPSLADTF